VGSSSDVRRLSDVAKVGIGYVTGANEFFHLRPSVAVELGIPKKLLQPTVRSGRFLTKNSVTKHTVASWLRSDEPAFLLKLGSGDSVPRAVRRYLDSPEGIEARTAYKCRVRKPWYVVPDVVIPDG